MLTSTKKVLTLATIALLIAFVDSRVAFAVNAHFTEEPVCTVVRTNRGPAIQCVGGQIAGLGGEAESALLEAELACETKSGANQPGGHLQSDEVEIPQSEGVIKVPPLLTEPARCPRGLIPVVGDTVDLVILNAAGEEIFRETLPVE
jgi:hypothetical protein